MVEGADAVLVRHLRVIARIENSSMKAFIMTILHSVGFKSLRWSNDQTF